MPFLAAAFEPPYYAVVFSSRRPARPPGADGDGYEPAAERMVRLAAGEPGYLGHESVRDAEGRGITVCYWRTRADVERWRAHPEHLAAQRAGRERWYEDYRVRVCRVERAYGGEVGR